MKKIFNILAGVAVMASVVACDVEYDPIVIIPNPELNKTGVQAVNTISIYDEQETVINVARTAGLSKEMNINVVVDEALIDEYNFQNGTSYELLPSEYYTLPEEVFLAKDSLDVDFTVVTKPAAMVAGLGRTEASDYILPLRIESPATGIDSKQDVISVLLRPVIADPKVTVEMPKTNPSLDFISIVHLPQTLDLTAVANFNTLDLNKIEFKALGQDEVDAYNAANGTSYVLLDSKYYKMAESFDAEAMIFKTAIEFSCWTLSDANPYLLPVEAKSTAYGVEQKETIYIAIQMSQLKVWLSKAEIDATEKQIEVGVEINTAMPDDLEFDLVYDAAGVEAYNTANGTSHAALDSKLVTIGKAVVKAGDKLGKAIIDLDLGAVPYDEGKFVAPLTIDANSLVEGTLVLEDQKTTCLLAYNTLVGNYSKEDWKSSVYHTDLNVRFYMGYYYNQFYVDLATNLCTSTDMPKDGQKYGTAYSYGMNIFYDIDFSKEIDPTSGVIADPEAGGDATWTEKPGSGCYALINLIDRTGGLDKLLSNYSYFNANTKEIFFTFTLQAYFSGAWQPAYHSGRYYDRTDK